MTTTSDQTQGSVAAPAAGSLVPPGHPVPVDRISELYRGEIFSDMDVRLARDRIHWMCAQCEGDTVLDVGCSQGIAAILLAREGFSVTAIDAHPESVAFARAEAEREPPAVQARLSIVETDLAALPEGPGFDSVLLGEVIEHQARPERLLKRAQSRLNPGGRLIVTTPFGLHPHPDHKVSLFPSDLVRFAREMGMGISRLEVDGSYMRCVYEASAEPAHKYPELEDLLERTERATLESEQRLHDLVSQLGEQLKKSAQALKITQRKLAEATTGHTRVGVSPSAVAVKAPVQRAKVLPLAAPRPAKVYSALPSDLKRLKVAAVMDEFTFHSFAPECELLSLRPQTWEEDLAGFAPDLVFIESAWRGADDLWTQKVSNPSSEIMGVIAWCARKGVPSVFWNKEDPVHFGTFQHIAKAVDYVFTTDVDCIARYKRDVGHDGVYLLTFAAQPAVHNPIERFERRDAFCFAGAYYLKYPERQRDFRNLMDVVSQLRPVDIYDRNHRKPHPHHDFPSEYEKYIVGSLPFDQIDKAYKGYRFGINMNTIKQSQTMFARRVFELLASNTVVVSNFSRGVRVLFGDLVVCSDAPVELERRLTALCADETRLRKFRLAGVRKVMAEHTYAHRLAYLTAKVRGTAVASAPPGVTVIACAANADEVGRLLAMFRAQRHAARKLILVTRGAVDAPGVDLEVLDPDSSMQRLREAVASAAWVAPLSAADYYGPNYLTDLVLATRYSAAEALGKGALHDGSSGAIELRHDGAQYRSIPRLDARSAMAQGAWLAQRMPADAAALAGLVLEGGEFLAIDEFNYCRDASGLDEASLASRVDDEPGWSHGLSIDLDLLPLAENLQANTSTTTNDGEGRALPGESAEELAALLPQKLPSGLSIRLVDGLLEVRSQLAATVHRYVYLANIFSRAELNLEVNSRFQLVLADDLASGTDLRTVFEFLDEDKGRISHAMLRAGTVQSMAIPARCRFVRFGLRVQGPVVARIQRLVLADLRERPSAVIPTARHLLVTKQYPSYDDLYRYGFVHSRVRGYRRDGLSVDIFRLQADEPCAFREFEDVDVVQGDRDLLDLALRSGRYEHVLVHLLDAQMWETLARHVDRVRVTVWVHGAEIQTWQRREFEFDGLDETEVARRKALSDQRAAFWQQLLGDPPSNLSLVFVSQYVAEQAQQDLGIDLSRVPHQVIHNFIDGDLFAYRAKDVAQRSRILSIRPFASRVYANDLTVRAILLLSERPCFASLSFHIVGDGELFDETTRPLAGLPNVTLHKGFLTQREIAVLHREHGIFLCPTRMDTQGVSRDEAMASGLVPITMRVAAVPEFVDDACGILVDAEDAGQLADAIEALQADPQRFTSLSQAAAARVRHDSGMVQTIARELDWLRR